MRTYQQIICVLALLSVLSVAWGQRADRATVTGVVTDQTGNSVPNATVKIRNEDTGVETTLATNAAGAYSSPSLVLGAYAITFPFARVKTLIFLVFIVTVVELPALVVLGFWFVGQLLEVGKFLRGVGHTDGDEADLAVVSGLSSGIQRPDFRALGTRLVAPDKVADRILLDRHARGLHPCCYGFICLAHGA